MQSYPQTAWAWLAGGEAVKVPITPIGMGRSDGAGTMER